MPGHFTISLSGQLMEDGTTGPFLSPLLTYAQTSVHFFPCYMGHPQSTIAFQMDEDGRRHASIKLKLDIGKQQDFKITQMERIGLKYGATTVLQKFNGLWPIEKC